MGKDTWRAYLRWLDEASYNELATKHAECLQLLASLTDVQFRSELRRIIRLIEEEQLIRLGIHRRMSEKGPNSQE